MSKKEFAGGCGVEFSIFFVGLLFWLLPVFPVHQERMSKTRTLPASRLFFCGQLAGALWRVQPVLYRVTTGCTQISLGGGGSCGCVAMDVGAGVVVGGKGRGDLPPSKSPESGAILVMDLVPY